MILDLNIEDFAIIDKISISFGEGLNILTGETGAGKSIIVDAINLLLGERADKSFIRYGAEKARVEAVFETKEDSNIERELTVCGIEPESDGLVISTREIYSSGRSVARINGRVVTLSMMKNIVSRLINIQSQNENQKLLLPSHQLEVIDAVSAGKSKSLKKSIKEEYEKFKRVEAEIKNLSSSEMEKERKMDLLKFQIEEISDASLKSGEEEQLAEQYKKLSAKEDIKTSIQKSLLELSGSMPESSGVLDKLNQVYTDLSRVEQYDEKLKMISQAAHSIYYDLEELNRDIIDYSSSLEYSEIDIDEVSKRLDMINNLKRKYGSTLEDILKYREEMESELETLLDLDNRLLQLEVQKKKLSDSLTELSNELSEIRKKAAKLFESNIVLELKSLNMEDSVFKVDFKTRDVFSENGTDKIEFMISTNKGQPLKPLSKVVSGGELSRIMLAFKNIQAEKDECSTLIFDEIDTGISGRTAQLVGEKISAVSEIHQLICITHLPQIAAMADIHFRISKSTKAEKTTAEIKKLCYDEKVEELTRLIGGANLTETTRKHAVEMIDMTKTRKNKT